MEEENKKINKPTEIRNDNRKNIELVDRIKKEKSEEKND